MKDKQISFSRLDVFFTKIMLDIIVMHTNRKIEETMVQLQSILAEDSSR